MSEIRILSENVAAAMEAAPPEMKQVLNILLGQQAPKPVKKPLAEIIRFADVCAAAGVSEYTYDDDVNDDLVTRVTNQIDRCSLINRVANDCWMPKMNDTDQPKWRIWAKLEPTSKDTSDPAGFGLSFGDCRCGRSSAGLGVRPLEYFKDEPTAAHVAKYFLKEYELLMQLEWQLWAQETL